MPIHLPGEKGRKIRMPNRGGSAKSRKMIMPKSLGMMKSKRR